MGKIDISLSNGMRDFFFHQEDTTGLTYNYYGWTDVHGIILIMRMPKDELSALYWAGTGTFAAAWADKANKSYVVMTSLGNIKVE